MNNVFWILACGVMVVLLLTVTYDFVSRIIREIKIKKGKKEIKKCLDDLVKEIDKKIKEDIDD